MSKGFRKIGMSVCLAALLAGAVLSPTVPVYAQTPPSTTAAPITPQQFLQNNAAILQPPGIGQNVQNLLTGNGNIADAISPEMLANVLNSTGLELPPELMNATGPILSMVQQGLQQGQITPEAATNLITDLALGVASPALEDALGAVGLNTNQVSNIMNTLTSMTGGMPSIPGIPGMPGVPGTGGTGNGGGGGGGGGSGQTQDSGDYRVQSMDVAGPAPYNGCDRCGDVGDRIKGHYTEVRQTIKDEFIKHRNWIVNTYWKEHILPALMLMAEQLTAVGIAQVEMIGAMLDAKHQLETQRLFQTLTAQAHKDYHPSEGMCTFGTTVRSLAASERKSDLIQTTLASRMMQRQTLSGDTLSLQGESSDIVSRIEQFMMTYCDPMDNSGGLDVLCKDVSQDVPRRNIDVDFTRNIESRLTLKMDLSEQPYDGTTSQRFRDLNQQYLEAITAEERGEERDAALEQDLLNEIEAEGGRMRRAEGDQFDVFALSANLFSNNVAPRIDPQSLASSDGRVRQDGTERYMDLRAIFAKRSVAQNSFAALTALRAEGDEGSAPYTKALLKELGITSQDEIEKILGEKPSYFAQMEVLTKKIYQNPSFYTELYDKPVNVERKGAAIEAISLMQDRDLYNSLLRSEAVLSVLLETMLMKEQSKIVNAMPETN